MKPHLWFVCGALLAALGVVNGAFAAHGLRDNLPKIYGFGDTPLDELPDDAKRLVVRRLGDYETGARYQMYHSFGLMLLGAVASRRPSKLWSAAGVCFFFGILLFSGCLYALVWTNKTILGAVVPIGGTLFIIGWVLAAIAGTKLAVAEPSATS